eukprot:762572-Hanusia_phi.AAC.2
MKKEGIKELSYMESFHVGPLDPLLASLVHYNTNDDLSERISKLFDYLDKDDSGLLSFKEISNGLRHLDKEHAIHFSYEDFEEITEHFEFCNEDEEISSDNFELIVRAQLKRYVQRRMAATMVEADMDSSKASPVLFVLKQLTLNIEEVKFLPPASLLTSRPCCRSAPSRRRSTASSSSSSSR